MGDLRLHIVSIDNQEIQPNILSVVRIIADYRVLLCSQVSKLRTPIYLKMTIIKANILKILVADKTQENFLVLIVKYDFFVSFFSTCLPFKMIPVVNERFCIVLI